MSDAIHNPVRGRRRGGSDADEFALGQSPDVVLPAFGSVERESEIIQPVQGMDLQGAVNEAAFMEEPMTIYIEPSGSEESEQFAYVCVNGKDAEVFDQERQRWVSIGYLPVGREITTKRKYVEVLARSKPQKVKTRIDDPRGDPRNVIQRFTHSRFPFSVLEDRNPQGRTWLSRIKAEG